MTWYFAYGSNLWIEQMVARTGPLPSDPHPRIARLFGYRLAFNMRAGDGQMYANIVSPGECVLGVIYPAAAGVFEKLDAFEVGYDRERITVVDLAGNSIEAFVYRAKPAHVFDGSTPSAEYLRRILRGGRQHSLPEAYLHEIEVAARPSH